MPSSCAEVEELAQCVEIHRSIRTGGELPGPDGRLVQNLAEDAVDGRRRLGSFLFGQARQPVVQPVQFGVSEPPDLRVHRGDDGRGRRLFLSLDIGGGLSGDDGTDPRDLARYRPVR